MLIYSIWKKKKKYPEESLHRSTVVHVIPSNVYIKKWIVWHRNYEWDSYCLPWTSNLSSSISLNVYTFFFFFFHYSIYSLFIYTSYFEPFELLQRCLFNFLSFSLYHSTHMHIKLIIKCLCRCKSVYSMLAILKIPSKYIKYIQFFLKLGSIPVFRVL